MEVQHVQAPFPSGEVPGAGAMVLVSGSESTLIHICELGSCGGRVFTTGLTCAPKSASA